MRNSHQIHQCLPRRGRAAHEHCERRPAKECFGSNRDRQERLQLPAATMTKMNHKRHKTNPSSGSTTARAALLFVSPCHTLSTGERRAYGDGETTAGLTQAGDKSKIDRNKKMRRVRRTLPVCKETNGNRKGLTNSYRNGCISRHLERFFPARIGLFFGKTPLSFRQGKISPKFVQLQRIV